MGKRGQNNHLKRIATPSAIAISNKKDHVWISKSEAGPHDHKHSIPLVVFLRDILEVCKTNKEARDILNNRFVSVDGKVRTREKFPIGLMDLISLEKADKYYRILIEKHGRLVPTEVKKDQTKEKIAKITKKFTKKKGEIMITLHDGKTIKADNNVKVGDSIIISIPENKIKKVLKMEKGATCLIKGGKHSGAIAKIQEIIKRGAGKGKEARMKSGKEEFITVIKHLCVVDDRIEGAV